ncbi:MAG: LLM class flavin-dependent oxidoreductase [Pseudomonadota bacterium]
MEFWLGLYGMQSPRVHPRAWSGLYDEVVEHAEFAESVGFDSFWLTEHHFWYDGYCPDLYPVLAAIARRTSKIGLGTGASLLGLHDPLREAQQIATLDNISNGRVILGLAPGYRPEEFEGLDIEKKKRGKRFYEACQVMEKAFSGETFSHEGEFFSYRNVRLNPGALQQPGPPMWVGANRSHQQARNIGRAGLGFWEGPSMSIETFAENVEIYKQALRDSGHSEDKIQLGLFRDICIAETEEEALQIMDEDLLPMYEEQYVAYGYVPEASGSRREMLADPVFKEIIAASFVGTPEHVIREIERYREAVPYTHFMPRIMHMSQKKERLFKQIELFAREVIPHFKQTSL